MRTRQAITRHRLSVLSGYAQADMAWNRFCKKHNLCKCDKDAVALVDNFPMCEGCRDDYLEDHPNACELEVKI